MGQLFLIKNIDVLGLSKTLKHNTTSQINKNEKFFPVERYASTVPLFMQYLPYRDRFSVEETCKLWGAIGTAQGWKDVKVLRLKKSDWTITTDDSWKLLSLTEATNAARRMGRNIKIIKILEYCEISNPITKQFIRCAANSLVSIDLKKVCFTPDLAKCLVKIKTLRELTLFAVHCKSCKYLKKLANRLTVFRMGRPFFWLKYFCDGKFLGFLDPTKLKILQLDCYKADLTCLNNILDQFTDNLQEIKLYHISEPYQIIFSLAEKQRPSLKTFELKMHVNSNNYYPCTIIKTPLRNIPRYLYKKLVLAAPQLEDLKIRYEQHESLMSIQTLTSMSVNLKNLYSLNLSICCLSEGQLKAVTANLVNLKVFVMDYPQNDVTFEFLSNLPNLHTLKIRNFDGFDNYVDKYRSIFKYALNQLNLKTLDLRDAVKLDSLDLFNELVHRAFPLTIFIGSSRPEKDLSTYLYRNKNVRLGNAIMLNFEGRESGTVSI